MKTQYKNNNSGKIVTVIDPIAAGMCNKTLGLTLVIYKEAGNKFHQVMEHKEFYHRFTKINENK